MSLRVFFKKPADHVIKRVAGALTSVQITPRLWCDADYLSCFTGHIPQYQGHGYKLIPIIDMVNQVDRVLPGNFMTQESHGDDDGAD